MAESDDEFIETPSVGDRLKAAREAKKLSLEDIADQTRIPLRHLQNLEAGDWSALPAPTYTIGFAKSYASAVGLDRTPDDHALRGCLTFLADRAVTRDDGLLVVRALSGRTILPPGFSVY